MIIIVDNGKGSQEISQFLRVRNEVATPKEALTEGACAYIISDGVLKKDSQSMCTSIMKNVKEPVLGIGLGAALVAGHYGAKIKEAKPKQPQEFVMLKKPCPLLLDLKRKFAVMKDSRYCVNDMPENLVEVASSKSGTEVFIEAAMPHFGVHFNPELGGDGRVVLNNFAKFVDMWEKYHK